MGSRKAVEESGVGSELRLNHKTRQASFWRVLCSYLRLRRSYP
jgi:hypothetical protein